MLSARYVLPLLLPAAALAATTAISTAKPIIDFSLPTFTADGYRDWLVRGTQALYVNEDRIDITDLTLTVFSGKADDRVQTVLLSPDASVHPTDGVVSGPSTIRVINDDIEASGSDWHYFHKQNRVTIARDVHVVFQAELKDILQ